MRFGTYNKRWEKITTGVGGTAAKQLKSEGRVKGEVGTSSKTWTGKALQSGHYTSEMSQQQVVESESWHVVGLTAPGTQATKETG